MITTPPPVASPAFEIPAKASLGKVSDDAQTTAMKQHGTPSDAKDGGRLSPAFVAMMEALQDGIEELTWQLEEASSDRMTELRSKAQAAIALAEAEIK